MAEAHPRRDDVTTEQHDPMTREFLAGAGYDRAPRFIRIFSDCIGRAESRILNHIAHRTLGYNQHATGISTEGLSAVAGTRNYMRPLGWLMEHGVIGREQVIDGGRATYAYWLNSDYTTWTIPDDVRRRILELRRAGVWSNPRFSSRGLRTIDRTRLLRIRPDEGYDVGDLRSRIAGRQAGEGAEAPPAPPSGGGTYHPQAEGPSLPHTEGDRSLTERERDDTPDAAEGLAMASAGDSGGPGGVRRAFVQRAGGPGHALQAVPATGHRGAKRHRSTAAAPLDAPPTPSPDGGNGPRQPAAGGENGDDDGNGQLLTERPPSGAAVGEGVPTAVTDRPSPGYGDQGSAAPEVRGIEQRRMEATNGLHHVSVIGHQMERAFVLLLAQLKAAGYSTGAEMELRYWVVRTMGRMIMHHEARVLRLPEALRLTEDEFVNIGVRVCPLESSSYRRHPTGGHTSGPIIGCFDPARTPLCYSAGDVGLWTDLVTSCVEEPERRRLLLSDAMLSVPPRPAEGRTSRRRGDGDPASIRGRRTARRRMGMTGHRPSAHRPIA